MAAAISGNAGPNSVPGSPSQGILPGNAVKNYTQAVKKRTVCDKIMAVACLISCIALTLIGAAALATLGARSMGHTLPYLSNIMNVVVFEMTIAPAWIASGVITVTGLACVAFRILREDKPIVIKPPLPSPPKVLTKEEHAALQAAKFLESAKKTLEKETASAKAATESAAKAEQELNNAQSEIKNLKSQIQEKAKAIKTAQEEKKKAQSGTADALQAASTKLSSLETEEFNLKQRLTADNSALQDLKNRITGVKDAALKAEASAKVAAADVQKAQKVADDTAAAVKAATK